MRHPIQPAFPVRAILLAGVAAWSPAVVPAAPSVSPADAEAARQILDAAGVRGGLVIHVGCGEGRRTAALRASEAFLVQGLAADPAEVENARAHVRALGLYGPVSIDRLDGDRLPYADNLATLVVMEEAGQVPPGDVMRVLAPGGVACVKTGDRWQKTVKPPPGNTDEWTHYLHDAGGNAVSHDTVVGPPRRVQWIAGPTHMRSHEHLPGLEALVTANGRIFYLLDEGSIASLRQTPCWRLVARDAYNGVLLWKRPVDAWFPHIVNWGATPPQLQRRLVSTGDRVFVTLGIHAPLSAVDAASGEVRKVYAETEGTEEIVFLDGTLLLVVRPVTAEREAELAAWAKLVRQEDSPVYVRDTAEPLVKKLRSTESRGIPSILAIEAGSGRELWRKSGPDVAGLRPLTLSASGDRACYQTGKGVVCADLKTGQERWSTPAPPLRSVSADGIVCADQESVTVLASDTGRKRWTAPTGLCQILDVFVMDGSIWAGGFKPWTGRSEKQGPSWGPYFAVQLDSATGKVLKRIEPEGPGHHHRCWKNVATERFILGGRRGVEFIDLKTGDVLWHSWVRGVCRYGVMPANGLLYAPPHACGCYIAAKLTGFYALSSGEGPSRPPDPPDAAPLERGPAYGALREAGSGIREASDWPTHRHDAARSGATQAPVPAALRVAWTADVGRSLSAPTVADGKVFAASVDDHRVVALDTASGQPAWTFTAGARVDSPPTIHAGRAIFGSRDGRVTSVRASDGALAWRLRIAREDRRVAVCGRIESVSPVPGSVLVRDGTVYATAGRSSYLDGGIDLCRIEAGSGNLLSRTPLFSPDPETGKQPPQEGPCVMPGTLADILSCDDRHIYLRDTVFDPAGKPRPQGDPHLFTLTGFLDDTWPHRSYWIFGTHISLATGCSGRDKTLLYGRILVFDASTVYGYGRANVHWSNQLEDGPYRLFARETAGAKDAWSIRPPIRVRAMVLAGETLFAAGPIE